MPGLDFEARFRREGEILVRLEHPNIARLLDAGSSGEGIPYFVPEYVEGVACTEWAGAKGRGLRTILESFTQVCDAVQFAHGNLIVHRDLKPSNILIDAGGTPHLLDFGISKFLGDSRGDQTATGFHAFSLNYASPEQILGRPATTADDVYSLGVLLYEMLTGGAPYRLAAMDLPEIVRFAGAAIHGEFGRYGGWIAELRRSNSLAARASGTEARK